MESVVFTFEPNQVCCISVMFNIQSASWDVVLHWFKFASEYNPSNLVCVALSTSNDFDKYQDWCCENFVEFIDGTKYV